jgi:hypothetical protein
MLNNCSGAARGRDPTLLSVFIFSSQAKSLPVNSVAPRAWVYPPIFLRTHRTSYRVCLCQRLRLLACRNVLARSRRQIDSSLKCESEYLV